MAELKTKRTGDSVDAFLDALPDEARRDDCRAVAALMRKATGAEARMWGPAIVGFGDHHYRYESGRENDWFQVGFSPRKAALTIYLMGGLQHLEPQLAKLGKYKTSKGCLYVKRLADVDQAVLREMIERAVELLRRAHREARPAEGK
jgi:uncharacterized protein YdhG (YjbR/CyaY superfamily)